MLVFSRLAFGAIAPWAGTIMRIAQGTHDLLSLSQALWLAALVPDARYVVLPLAGLSGVADVPHRVIQLVDEAVAASA